MEGNRVADGAGFAPYLDGLHAAARRLTASDHEAEDLVQDCLASAVRGAARVRVGVLGAWLHQILRRRWYDVLRRRGLERKYRDAERPRATADAEAPGHEVVRRALAALDAESRRVLEMRFFQSRTSVEIARELKRPAGTVRSQLFHALRKFESEFTRLCPKETL
jgi:RNA polymerase sigma-70 factor (ECF subfamily)